MISDAWIGGVFHADELHARNYSKVVFGRFDDDLLFGLLSDLEWASTLRLPAMMADQYDGEVRNAMRRRLSKKVLRLLHRLRKGATKAA